MSDFKHTGRWRHRVELVEGEERLILQIEERDCQSDALYGRNLAKVQWRDAKTTDLAIPPALVPQQPLRHYDPSRCLVCGGYHGNNMPCPSLSPTATMS